MLSAMIDPELRSEALALLNRARLIAEAPAAGAVQIGHAHPQSQFPPGLRFTSQGSLAAAQPSTLQAFGERINRAISHDSEEELRGAIRWCAAELHSLQHGSKQVAESPAEFEARIVQEYEGVIAPVVAARERTYVRKVREARVKRGRTARLGHKLGAKSGAVDGAAGEGKR